MGLAMQNITNQLSEALPEFNQRNLRVSQEVVELNPADGGLGFEVREHISEQNPGHGAVSLAGKIGE